MLRFRTPNSAVEIYDKYFINYILLLKNYYIENLP